MLDVRWVLALVILVAVAAYAQQITLESTLNIPIGTKQNLYITIENTYDKHIKKIYVYHYRCTYDGYCYYSSSPQSIYDDACKEIGDFSGYSYDQVIPPGGKATFLAGTITIEPTARRGPAYLHCPARHAKSGLLIRAKMADDTEWSKVVWIDSLNLVPQGEKGFDILIVSSEKGSAYITQLEQEVKTLRQQVETLKSQQTSNAATATITTTVIRTETVTKTVANPETVTVVEKTSDMTPLLTGIAIALIAILLALAKKR